MPIQETITIEQRDDGTFIVHEGEKNSGRLQWAELLGHVAALTIPQRLKDQSRIYQLLVEEPKKQSFIVKTTDKPKSSFEPAGL